MTVGGRLTQPGTDTAIGNLAGRTKALEQASHGHLIYVGTYPTDPNTSPDSPPFQNSWGNIGGNYPPLAFCINATGFVEFEGTCSGGVDGTVVFTLPEGYRPDQSQRFVAALSAGSDFCTIQVDPTGDVTLVARGFDPGNGGLAAAKISTAGATAGQVLTDVGGVATWANPSPGTAATTDIEVATILIGSRGTLNLTDDGIASVSAADDAPNSRVNIQVGVSPSGTDGDVLTTVGGVAAWASPSMPPTPPAVYPTIQVGGLAIGSEPTINFVEENVVLIAGVDHAGTTIEIDIGLAAGAEGQVVQTVAGVPAWTDLLIAKTLVECWFGALPVAVGPTQVLRVPYIDGVSRVFDVNRLFLRVETPGATATMIQLQKSSSPTGFTPTNLATVTVAGGDNQGETTGSLGTVQSGDLVRVNFTAIGAGAASFYAEFESEEEV